MTSPRRLRAAENQRRAVELRMVGLTYEQIMAQTDYRSGSGVKKAIDSALAKTLRETTDAYRDLELMRLDKLMAGLWPRAIKGDTFAVDRVLKIMERRAKLLGLDAPTKREIAGPDGGAIPFDVNVIAAQAAAELGISVEQAIAEAERMLAERA